ncbi:MAG: leucine-rich repeat domain-containing protein, partial [Anaerotignum sp.]|nr:leucine-rich repeat domain-containing protein [Anaerotignum sp.]
MKKKRFLALLLSFALMIPTVGVSAEGYEPSRTEISVEEVQTDEPVVDEPVIDEPEAGIPAQESTVPTEEDVSSELTLFGDYADDTMELAWGECGDNLTWSLVVDLDYTLIISGTGEMYDYTADSQPWDDYKDDISEVVVEDGVTSVGGYAFYTYSGLTSVSLPDELAEIGDMAFCGTGLTEVTVPASVTYIGGDAFAASALETVTMLCSPSSWDLAFEECLSLTEVVLPDHMTSISYGAFHICTALTEITIPSAMEHISESAFGMCYNLENVYYNGTEEEWNEITIGENNEYLTGATIHFTEAEVSAELMLQFSSVSIEAGDEASFDEFTIMSSDGFTSGDKLTLTLSDGFSFAEEQTLIDGDTEITYKWIDDTELQVTVPEDPGDGFDLNGLTILAEDGLNDGDEAKIIVSGEGYVSDTATVAFVGEGGTEVNDFLELYVEEPRQIIPGGTAVFDSMLLIKDTAFSESDVITFTLNEGFTFVEGMTITDVGNPITILEVDGDTLVIQAPSDIDGEFGLDGLTIAADADVAVGTRIYLTASMDGYGEAKDRIGRVVDEITDEIWLRFEEIDLTAGETTAFEDFCIMKYFEFDPGEAVTLTLSEGFYFPVSQTMMDGDTQIDYALSNDREMVIYAPQFPGNGFDLVGLTIGTESGVERRTEVTLTVTVEGCEAIEEEVGMVTTAAAGNVLYLDVDPVKIKAGGMASFETLGVDKDEEFTAGDKVTLTLNEGFSFQENDVYHDHNGNIIERFSWSEKEIVVLAPEDPGFGFDLEELTIIADKDVAVGTKARMTASMDGYEPTTETAATVIDGAAVISGTCGPNLTWTYDPDTDTLTITGIGAMYDYIFNGGGHDVPIAVANEIIAFEATSEAPWADYRTDITAVTVEEGVTSIGDYAFAGCSNLEEVTLPNSLTDIGDGAFYGCSSLTDVYYSGTEAEWA